MIKALAFDVFGTVVDWRASIAEQVGALAAAKQLSLDAHAFADAWRAQYQPAMEQVRSGQRGWVKLDDLHRENLDMLLPQFGLEILSEAERHELNLAWHRLRPWPDVVAGLWRMREQFVLSTLSNANTELLTDLAEFADLPWHHLCGAESAGHYKPQPAAYLNTAAQLKRAPQELMLVAAHNSDLLAAQNCGLRTAFVRRPTEHGLQQQSDLQPSGHFDYTAEDFADLAEQLGC